MGIFDSFFLGVNKAKLDRIEKKLDNIEKSTKNASSSGGQNSNTNHGYVENKYGELDAKQTMNAKYGTTLGSWKNSFENGKSNIYDANGNVQGVVFGTRSITPEEARELSRKIK